MKICEQIFKKRLPQYNSNALTCKKNHDIPNNSRYRFTAINKIFYPYVEYNMLSLETISSWVMQ